MAAWWLWNDWDNVHDECFIAPAEGGTHTLLCMCNGRNTLEAMTGWIVDGECILLLLAIFALTIHV